MSEVKSHWKDRLPQGPETDSACGEKGILLPRLFPFFTGGIYSLQGFFFSFRDFSSSKSQTLTELPSMQLLTALKKLTGKVLANVHMKSITTTYSLED